MHLVLILAEEAAASPEATPPWFANPMMMMGLIMVLGYFMLFRPAQRQEQQRKALIAGVKKNDKIINSGGIIGVVDSVKEKEDEVVLRGGLRITKSSIVRILTAEDAVKDQA